MTKTNTGNDAFRAMNAGYDRTFKSGKLSLGLVVPIETYQTGPIPNMKDQFERIKLAEELGFAAVWLRDVPFNVPSFGDAGQIYDPFVYLGALSVQTSKIALGVASIILPLRHPAHVAKAAASVDILSDGRLLLGIASGDRPEEYPALARDFHPRGQAFRESYDYIRAMAEERPRFANTQGVVQGGMDLLPKPVSGALPMLVTGSSQQSPDWIARNADGWMTYPLPEIHQARRIADYRAQIREADEPNKPVMEPLYIDLADDPDRRPRPIHLGMHLGASHLIDYLASRQDIGVNHVALNLRFNQANIEETLERLAKTVLPHFS